VSAAADHRPPAASDLPRVQRLALIAGGGVLVACTAYGVFRPETFFRAYLAAYTFCLGISLGCLAVLLMQYLTGGAWGRWLRPVLEAAAAVLPALAVLFLPILLAVVLHRLYPWADPAHFDELTEHKKIWLNPPFWAGRAVAYFAVWVGLSWLVRRGSRDHEAAGREPPRRFRVIGAVGLGLYGLTVTLAAIDWTMSLDPHWWSTMYGALVAVAQMLSGFAFATLAVAVLVGRRAPDPDLPPTPLRDFASLFLAFTMLWAYMAFSQFMLIWAGNLPEETRWYEPRLHGGWEWAALVLLVGQFALPFLMLLSGDVKTNPRLLAGVAALSLATRFVEQVWLTAATFKDNGPDLALLEVAALIGVGGVWLSLFLWRLQSRPLLPAPAALTPEALAND
jgi:hypothetical protein